MDARMLELRAPLVFPREPMIGVILNPNAARVRGRAGLRARLAEIAGARGEVVETHTPGDVADAARAFAARGVDLVATVGGDGTNLSAVTELVRAYGDAELPTIAFLRGGTVNTVASNLGVRGRPDQILSRLMARFDRVPTVEHDVMRVEVDGRAPVYGFMFAAAMGARYLAAYYGGPIPGMPWAVLLTARTMASSLVAGRHARWLFAPVDVDLTVDGEAGLAHPRLLVCATVKDLGLGFKVTWRAGDEPGRFHVIASELSTTRMALQLPRVFTGRPLAGGPHLDRLARDVDVRFRAPQTVTVDGELYRTTRVRVRSGPRLRIARV
jgi:diacylglycerol kinase (ATP)